MKSPLVLVVAASDSDLLLVSETAKVLEEFGVGYDITISSAHRSPDRPVKLVEKAYKSGVKVIICGAGLAAHLAGVVAAHFPLPVIGIPLKSGALNGLDALYATVQMPPGIPVATVAIDGARNAGILAIQILATSDKILEKKLIAFKSDLAKAVDEKVKKLDKLGLQGYIDQKK